MCERLIPLEIIESLSGMWGLYFPPPHRSALFRTDFVLEKLCSRTMTLILCKCVCVFSLFTWCKYYAQNNPTIIRQTVQAVACVGFFVRLETCMCESHTVYVGMQSVSPSLDCGTVFMLNFATFIHADSDSVQAGVFRTRWLLCWRDAVCTFPRCSKFEV